MAVIENGAPLPACCILVLAATWDPDVPLESCDTSKSKLMKRDSLLLPLAVSSFARFIMLLGIFLGSYVPVVAQTPAPQIVPSQERLAPTMTIH